MRLALSQSANYKWWVFIAIAIGTFVSVVDQLSVTVALPTIEEHFHTDLPTVQWVLVGYALTISALLLPMGRLSDIIGRRQVYIAGLFVFVLGAALAGSSPNIITLIVARVLQGCGAAMTQGTGMAMITSIFPGSERGKILGTHMSVVGSGAITGPAIGGLLVGALSWRWIFLISVPAGILAIAAALFILDRRRFLLDRQQSGFDWLGAALSSGMLITLLLAVTSGPRFGWASPSIVTAMLGSVALLVAFIWWELRASAPILDLGFFKRRTFSLGVSAGFISFFGTFSVFFLMPFYLQQVLGFGPGRVGLILVPNAFAMILMGPLSGRLSDRYGARRLKVAGMATSAAGLFLLSRLTDTSPLGMTMGGMILLGLGMGIFNSPNYSSILSAVERSGYGVISSFLNLIRNAASVMGIAVGTAIVTAVMASMGHLPSLEAVSAADDSDVLEAFTAGLRRVSLIMGGLMLAGLAVSSLKGDQPKAVPAQQVEKPQVEGSTPD